jgi:uncharacterized protein (DUF2236 family)
MPKHSENSEPQIFDDYNAEDIKFTNLKIVNSNNTVPLDKDSLLWKYGGDLRIGLTGLSAGVLQLMHPAIGRGVAEHSKFFEEPWDRVFRSIPRILGTIYNEDGDGNGHEVRDFHKNIKGFDSEGKAYHALHPETFWWAHATFHNMVEDMIDRFDNKDMTQVEREQLYQETSQWYRRYGVSTRPLPQTYEKYKEKWDEVCENDLELTPAAEKALEIATQRSVERIPQVPSVVWKLGKIPVSEIVYLITVGGLPQNVRERFDIPWSPSIDGTRLKVLELAIRKAAPLRPFVVSYYPTAQKGIKRSEEKTI